MQFLACETKFANGMKLFSAFLPHANGIFILFVCFRIRLFIYVQNTMHTLYQWKKNIHIYMYHIHIVDEHLIHMLILAMNL